MIYSQNNYSSDDVIIDIEPNNVHIEGMTSTIFTNCNL